MKVRSVVVADVHTNFHKTPSLGLKVIMGRQTCGHYTISQIFLVKYGNRVKEPWCFVIEQGSLVSVVTRLRDGRPRFDSKQRQGFFSSPPRLDRFWGRTSLLSSEYWDSFPGGKLTGT
jgi:hypothetical protein